MYTLGKDNGRVDALSRRKDIAGTKQTVNETLLTTNLDRLLGLLQTINNIITIRHDVLEELQEAIIRQHYNDTLHSYLGIRRTIEQI